ncbi:MAG: hypothetical protein COA91_01470 [Robiginitomaculum sp.]|nr:MAG: hypothetical protein COA91_01470 [Robiginitomaculum sp.]
MIKFFSYIAVSLFILILPAESQAQLTDHKDTALLTDTTRPLLDAGQVLIEVKKEINGGKKMAFIQSVILIPAPPEAVWSVLTDCARAPSYIPGLKTCEVLDTAPDGLWDIHRHVTKISAFLPKMISEVRSEYTYPTSIRFKRIGGNVDVNQGAWTLRPDAYGLDASRLATIVIYTSHVSSKSVVPDRTIRKSMEKNIPKVMSALRSEVLKDIQANK